MMPFTLKFVSSERELLEERINHHHDLFYIHIYLSVLQLKFLREKLEKHKYIHIFIFIPTVFW